MSKYNWLDQYLAAKPGATKNYKAEWQWDRYLVGNKMFAAICTPDLKYQDYGGRQLVSLKCDPREAGHLVTGFPEIVPGFYMDKKHWISVFLDQSLDDNLLQKLSDDSYELIFSKLTKKLRLEIISGAADPGQE